MGRKAGRSKCVFTFLGPETLPLRGSQDLAGIPRPAEGDEPAEEEMEDKPDGPAREEGEGGRTDGEIGGEGKGRRGRRCGGGGDVDKESAAACIGPEALYVVRRDV